VPNGLPPSAERMLRQVTWNHRLARSPKEEWFTTLADRPRRGPIEATVRELAKAALRLSITR
jgi:acetoin utilization protein AcuC